MARSRTGRDHRRLSRTAGARVEPSYRAAFHRLPAVEGRSATDYEGWFVVAARGYGLTGAKIQEKLSRRKVFVRRDGSEDRPMGNFDAPALHEKAIDKVDPQTQENDRAMARFTTALCLAAAWVLFLCVATLFAAAAPTTLPQIALYQGADRDKILLEGAKKEGQLTFYDSHTWFRTYIKDFEKKYPFIKVSEWRSDSKNLLSRAMTEFNSSRSLVDVIETTAEAMGVMKRDGMFQEYFTPEARFYPDAVKAKGKNGVYYLGDRETYNSLGFNTTLIGTSEAPKLFKDLLDSKWKGKMSIAGTSTGVRWVGAVIDAFGRDFLNRLAEQDIKVQDMS